MKVFDTNNLRKYYVYVGDEVKSESSDSSSGRGNKEGREAEAEEGHKAEAEEGRKAEAEEGREAEAEEGREKEAHEYEEYVDSKEYSI
ncbi:hypothetical protein Glove_52g71 [Diversispora epigaea]|uniref:Uncharacterized protein n=1 Tax=Diversispora epigaea TaxID=1348612 RepID=A0A397JN15_9GLOM|nr:hypothetical protein Glove_52g71 [Diversispora epigaea]